MRTISGRDSPDTRQKQFRILGRDKRARDVPLDEARNEHAREAATRREGMGNTRAAAQLRKKIAQTPSHPNLINGDQVAHSTRPWGRASLCQFRGF